MVKFNPQWIANDERRKLKKNFDIKNFDILAKKIKNNYNDDLNLNIIEIYFILTHYRKRKYNYLKAIIEFIIYLLDISTTSFKNILKKNIYLKSKLIVFSYHKYVDQLNFSEISNYLYKKKQKHLVIINHKNTTKYKIQKLYKNKNIISLSDNLKMSNLISGSVNFIRNFKNINKIIRILKCKKVRFEVYKLYLNFFIFNEIWFKIMSYNKPNKFLISYFSRHNSLINIKNRLKLNTKFYGYAFTGLDADTSRYLFHNIDLLMVIGKIDLQIIEKVKKHKLNFMKMPKKLTVVGSPRTDFFLKNNYNLKKITRKFKILYIKSNPYYLNGLDDKALIFFSKIIRKLNNVEFLIKDRENQYSNSIDYLIQKKIIKKENITKTKYIEKLILDSDLCIGTNSTALVRQSINLKRPIIQLFADKHYMYDFSDEIFGSSNKKKIKEFLLRIINNKLEYDKYKKKNINLYKKVLSFPFKSNKYIYKKLFYEK